MVGRTPKPEDDDFLLEEYPLYNLNMTSATYIETMSEAMKSLGYDQTIWRVLMLLDDQNPSAVGELARKSVTKVSTITRMLTRMENEGLIVREHDIEDRRIILVSMTDQGRRVLAQMKQYGSRVFEKAMEGFTAEEIRLITDLLKRIRGNLTVSPYATSTSKNER